MEIALAFTVGLIFACSTYLLLRRSLVKVVIGLALLSQAANLLIFTSAGLERADPPIIPEGAKAPLTATADPLPQALILTAIVISFGLIAFTLVLFQRAYRAIGTDDLDEMHSTDARVLPLEYRG
jgi:multicomponent Na+:H+ antiporter subunit C